MNTYRVFVTRHFIDVCYFDVKAPTPAKAKKVAESAANDLRSRDESRAKATDNTWIADEPVTIPELGYSAAGIGAVSEYKTLKSGVAYIDTAELLKSEAETDGTSL